MAACARTKINGGWGVIARWLMRRTRPYEPELRLRSYGLQIRNYRFRIAAIQAKLRHRKPKTIAVRPDASGQELDHVGVIGGGSAADPRRVDRPV